LKPFIEGFRFRAIEPCSLAGLTSGPGHGSPQSDENVMRIFIAIELPEDIRQALADFATGPEACDELGALGCDGFVHLTLKFLARLPRIAFRKSTRPWSG